MVNDKTYNNLVDTLEQLGNNHFQIKTVTSGDIFEIDLEKNTLFPLMHINPVNVTASKSQFIFNFQIFVMDLVEPDNSNEPQVYSTVLQICVDLISIFRNSKYQAEDGNDINDPIYFTEGDYTLEPFTERFDQAVTGWVFQIGVTVDNSFQTCNIPMET